MLLWQHPAGTSPALTAQCSSLRLRTNSSGQSSTRTHTASSPKMHTASTCLAHFCSRVQHEQYAPYPHAAGSRPSLQPFSKPFASMDCKMTAAVINLRKDRRVASGSDRLLLPACGGQYRACVNAAAWHGGDGQGLHLGQRQHTQGSSAAQSPQPEARGPSQAHCWPRHPGTALPLRVRLRLHKMITRQQCAQLHA